MFGEKHTQLENNFPGIEKIPAAHLDFLLLSEGLLPIFPSSKIHPSYRSEHCAVEIKLTISKFKRGTGIWKLNNSLLWND